MLETGVPNLDLLLGGGVPDGAILLVVGPSGSGKTTLAFQMAFHVAAHGGRALCVSTTSEPPTKLIQHLRPFSFYDERQIGERLFLLSAYPLVKEGPGRLLDALVQAVRERQAAIAVVDGLMTIRDLHPGPRELREFIYELGATLTALGCTTVLTSSGIDSGPAHEFAELTVADGIVELGMRDVGTRTLRTIRVRKMRGLPSVLGEHALRIDGRGLTAFPRLESIVEPIDVGLSRERTPLGLPELDAMMAGGLVAGSVTLLAGAPGTGKTLAGLQFIMEGVRRGEKGLIVCFRETRRHLVDRAGAFGLDLAGAVAAARAVVLHRPPVDLIADEVAWNVRQQVISFAPQRLLLDDFDELDHAIGDEPRRRGFLAGLTGLLVGRGITSLVTKEIPQVIGPELDFSGAPLATLAENLILLRYVEFRGELHRIISILKMRDTDHDRSIREYAITDRGLQVLARLATAEGLLTGIARLPSEARVKRRENRAERGV
ncbi:MAG: AAA family ATPase [Chloroflexi bacterium]|nr:AAA family ATPase [Chloroflexota bacterium]